MKIAWISVFSHSACELSPAALQSWERWPDSPDILVLTAVPHILTFRPSSPVTFLYGFPKGFQNICEAVHTPEVLWNVCIRSRSYEDVCTTMQTSFWRCAEVHFCSNFAFSWKCKNTRNTVSFLICSYVTFI